MGDTKIQWTGKTWNPIRARNKATGKVGWFCEHVSEGCRNCYAEKMNVNTYFGNGLEYKPSALDNVELFLDEKILTHPLHWRKPTMVFPCSMTDLFGRWVKDDWLDRIFAVMALAKQHTFQCLTKRPDRMREYVTRLRTGFETIETAARSMGYTFKFKGLDGKQYSLLPWPIPNVWLGTSVEDQKTADERIPLLLQTPAAVRWISYEPALGPVDLRMNTYALLGSKWVDDNGVPNPDHHKQRRDWLDWVVVGGESGPKARSFDLEWARSIVAQCKTAGVPVFVKQLGAKPYDESIGVFRNGHDEIKLEDKKGGDINEWPNDLRVREFPKVGSLVTAKEV